MATTVHNDARPCCLCGGPVVQWPEPTMEEEEEEEEDADDMTHPSLPPEQQWLCHAAVLKHNGERSPWRHQHPRRDVRAAAAERAAAAAGLAAEAARPDGSEQQEGRPVAGAGGDVSACGEEASGSNGGGQASDGGSWDFESDDGSGAGREGWGDPEGDASEDEEGDWAQPAILLEEGYSNKRLVLTPPSHLYHNRVQVSWGDADPSWYRVAAWPPPGAPHERHSIFSCGGALLLHARCGDMLERCLRARGPRVRMEDVWRYLIRYGCPDGSTIDYGGASSCWGGRGGRRFEADADSAWLLAEPPTRPPMPAASAPLQQRQAAGEALGCRSVKGGGPTGSGLLALDDDCLCRVAWTAERPQGVLALMRLATCCRRLRGFAAEQLPDEAEAWEQECWRVAPWLDCSPAPAPAPEQRRRPDAACGETRALAWRARYAVLARALEAPTSGLRNGLRIGGVIQRMLDELEAPVE